MGYIDVYLQSCNEYISGCLEPLWKMYCIVDKKILISYDKMINKQTANEGFFAIT